VVAAVQNEVQEVVPVEPVAAVLAHKARLLLVQLTLAVVAVERVIHRL
jgi:hypothetical protein